MPAQLARRPAGGILAAGKPAGGEDGGASSAGGTEGEGVSQEARRVGRVAAENATWRSWGSVVAGSASLIAVSLPPCLVLPWRFHLERPAQRLGPVPLGRQPDRQRSLIPPPGIALWEGKARRDQMERIGCGAMRGGRPGRGGPDGARRHAGVPPGSSLTRRRCGSETVQTLDRRTRGAACPAVAHRDGPRLRRCSAPWYGRLCQGDRGTRGCPTAAACVIRA